MAPRKGTTNNPNGRKAGIPNKSTDELRSVFTSFLEANLETMQADFDTLFPKERLNFIEKVAKMVLPSLPTAVEIRNEPVITGITFIDKD